MKKWILIIAAILSGCSAARPWTVPTDLTKGSATQIVGDAAAHNALGDLLRRGEESLLDTDEPRMAEFLRAALKTGKLTDAETATAEWMLHDVCERNAVDSIAADFRFATPESSENRLLTFRPGETLLMLIYDPDCDHCRQVIAELYDMENLPTVLAVCIEASPSRWEKTRDALPENWVKAYDRSGILEEDLYIIRSMPSLYLLDGSRHVILKNPTLSRLSDYLSVKKD